MMTVTNDKQARRPGQSGLMIVCCLVAALFTLPVACTHASSGDEERAAEDVVAREYEVADENTSEDDQVTVKSGSAPQGRADEASPEEDVAAMADTDPGNQAPPPDNNVFSADDAVKALLEPDEPVASATKQDSQQVISSPAESDDASVGETTATEPSAAPPSIAPPKLPEQPAAQEVASLSVLRHISYAYQAREGTLLIDLKTSGLPRYSVLQETNRASQPELVVRLFNTSAHRPVRRSLDASEFRSPVSFIRTRSNPAQSSVDVVLTLRDPVQPSLNASAGGLRLSYRIPDHWFGVRPLNVGKATAGEVAEPLAKANLYPKFEDTSRRPERIDEDPARKAIPPQGSVRLRLPPVALKDAGGAWRVGQDNNALPGPDGAANMAGLNAAGNAKAGSNAANVKNANAASSTKAGNNAASAVPNAVQNQVDIAAIAASPGNDITGQDQAGAGTARSARRINLDFRGAPLSEVIKAITDKSGVNFVYAGVVASIPVTIQLQEIPWDLAFKSILDLNSLGLVKIAPTLYRVDLLTNIAREREQIEAARVASQRMEPTRIMFLRLSYIQAGEMVGLVSEMLANDRARDPRIQIRPESRTNSLIVEAPARELAKVKALVERVDLQTPQVKIESRVVEAAKNYLNAFGISWNTPLIYDQSRGLGFGTLPFPNYARSNFAVEAGGSGGVGAWDFLFGSINNSFNLDLHLSMSQNEGLTETLQTNSVLVENNTSANIVGGNSDVFIMGGSGGSAAAAFTVDYSMSVSVTPTVTADGAVRMTVSITSNSPSETKSQNAQAGRLSRSINTVLLKRSGETAVIGGLNNRERTTGYIGVPILSKIPIIGALFRNNSKTETNRELLLMVTPTIMNAAQSAGDSGNANFEDDTGAGNAISASPDKLEDAGQTSEFQADDLGGETVGTRSAANNNAAANEPANEASQKGKTGGNEANNAVDANALDSALDSAVNGAAADNGLRAANTVNGAINAVDAAPDSADNAVGEGAE